MISLGKEFVLSLVKWRAALWETARAFHNRISLSSRCRGVLIGFLCLGYGVIFRCAPGDQGCGKGGAIAPLRRVCFDFFILDYSRVWFGCGIVVSLPKSRAACESQPARFTIEGTCTFT